MVSSVYGPTGSVIWKHWDPFLSTVLSTHFPLPLLEDLWSLVSGKSHAWAVGPRSRVFETASQSTVFHWWILNKSFVHPIVETCVCPSLLQSPMDLPSAAHRRRTEPARAPPCLAPPSPFPCCRRSHARAGWHPHPPCLFACTSSLFQGRCELHRGPPPVGPPEGRSSVELSPRVKCRVT